MVPSPHLSIHRSRDFIRSLADGHAPWLTTRYYCASCGPSVGHLWEILRVILCVGNSEGDSLGNLSAGVTYHEDWRVAGNGGRQPELTRDQFLSTPHSFFPRGIVEPGR